MTPEKNVMPTAFGFLTSPPGYHNAMPTAFDRDDIYSCTASEILCFFRSISRQIIRRISNVMHLNDYANKIQNAASMKLDFSEALIIINDPIENKNVMPTAFGFITSPPATIMPCLWHLIGSISILVQLVRSFASFEAYPDK